MERLLTPRQLLILVLTACHEAGYDTLVKQKVLDAIRELRIGAPDCVPQLNFILSGMKHGCADVEEAFNGLHLNGLLVFNALGGTITITEAMSAAEVYKPMYGDRREEVFAAMTPYIADFVRHVTRADPNAPKEALDPKQH